MIDFGNFINILQETPNPWFIILALIIWVVARLILSSDIDLRIRRKNRDK